MAAAAVGRREEAGDGGAQADSSISISSIRRTATPPRSSQLCGHRDTPTTPAPTATRERVGVGQEGWRGEGEAEGGGWASESGEAEAEGGGWRATVMTGGTR